ncbi:hypothetical protein ACHOLT_05795 [Desulfitobacterium sp. Sab5]|uniref:hypothetical protein n=1 Tax=Desulfitobacterium nosdiversum TaxID=3375356 RepID=UPI003CF9C159
MEIVIGKPKIANKENGNAVLSAEIREKDSSFELWFEVEKEYEKYLCVERSDAFLVSLLPWAMMRSSDKDICKIYCETPISEQLHHQLVNYYIPLLINNITYYHNVIIFTQTESEKLPSEGAVGTGISGGVDSSYTLAKYINCEDPNFQLTHGVYYNMGIYGGFDSKSERQLQHKVSNIAHDCNLRYIKMTSNTCLRLYEKAHAPIVPFVFIGATLAMQKLFSIYYYSSGFSASDFYFSEADAAYFDLLNVHCLSTQNTHFYSSGVETTRLKKVEFITDFPFTYDNLAVCLDTSQDKGNCGKCAKCTRTMAELEAIGKLDKYSEVFDVQAFRDHPGYHWGYVLLKSKSDSFCKEIVERYRAGGNKFPFIVYISSLKKWVLRGFTTENKKREKIHI